MKIKTHSGTVSNLVIGVLFLGCILLSSSCRTVNRPVERWGNHPQRITTKSREHIVVQRPRYKRSLEPRPYYFPTPAHHVFKRRLY